MNFDETVKMTIDWYKKFYQLNKDNMLLFTNSQINLYEKLAKIKDLSNQTLIDKTTQNFYKLFSK